MHKSKLAGFIIDCDTDDLDSAAHFWGGGTWSRPIVACMSQICDKFDIVQQTFSNATITIGFFYIIEYDHGVERSADL